MVKKVARGTSDGGVMRDEVIPASHDPPAAMTGNARVTKINISCLQAATPLQARGFFFDVWNNKILNLCTYFRLKLLKISQFLESIVCIFSELNFRDFKLTFLSLLTFFPITINRCK